MADAFDFFDRRSEGHISAAKTALDTPARDGVAELAATIHQTYPPHIAATVLSLAVNESLNAIFELSGAVDETNGIAFEHYTRFDPFSDIVLGDWLSPVFIDWDQDGDLDLITGTGNGFLMIYEGHYDGTYHRWDGTNPFQSIGVANFAAPAFVDLDGDGDLDVVIGSNDGQVVAFRNGGIGWSGQFQDWGFNYPLGQIDVGTGAAPTFQDLDGDGDLDMLVGNGAGQLITFRNGGNGWSGAFQAWGANDPFANIYVDSGSTPVFVDLDGDGDKDLVVGTRFGEIEAFINGGNGWRGIFRPWGENDPFRDVDVELRSAPTFADLDYDGDLDLVSGSAHNGLYIYENLSGEADKFVFASEETIFETSDAIL